MGLVQTVEEEEERRRENRHRHAAKLLTRGHWRPTEDSRLRELVTRYGAKNWNFIAQNLAGRSGKSCRLRWFNQLDPRINRRPFTAEEEEKLVVGQLVYGSKWALLARLFFPGRTDNAVKNQWHVIEARKNRRTKPPPPAPLPPPSSSSSSSSSSASNYPSPTTTGVDDHPFFDFLGVGST